MGWKERTACLGCIFMAPQPAYAPRRVPLFWLREALAGSQSLGWGWGSWAGAVQGSQWGTGLLCGRPQLWDEGAVITGEGALGMWGQEHEGTGRCSGAVELCGYHVGLGVHWGLQKCRGDLWVQRGAESVSRERMGHKGVQGVQ